MTKGLTDKQENILEFINDYVNERGYPPSIREIGLQFQISSLRGVTVHLDALERKGYIKRANTSRSITILGRTGSDAQRRDTLWLPIVGTIAAGTPITATENIENHLAVPAALVKSAHGAFLLQVKGDSMIEAHILDGDYVIIKPQPTALHGEIVAALLGEEATVKRYDTREGKVRLMPANPHFQPIPVEREDSRIIGKVIGLLRNMQ